MKLILQFSLISFLFTGFIACNNSPEGEAATTGEATTTAKADVDAKSYTIDASQSTILWEGSKPNGKHNGTIGLKSGGLQVKDGNIQSGKFIIDMNSISCTDLEGDQKASIEAHLKGTRSPEEQDDFFNVAKFPTAEFEIASVTPLTGDANGATHSIKGNLTMKGVSYSVEFPTKVSMDGNGLVAETSAFTIDRTKWGITFMSPTALNLKEKFLNDEIGLRIKLAAK